MKLLRYGESGRERPGALDRNGEIRDLSALVSDISSATLSGPLLASLAAVDIERLPRVSGAVRLGPCVGNPSKFVCIGLNYRDHAREVGLPIPEEPVLFQKATSSICGPHDPIRLPRSSAKTDWEVELGVVIGTRASHVNEQDALAHVAGYCVVNDVSERAFQMERGGQWTKGKSADTFGPVGPWLVTRDDVRDPQALDIWLKVDGRSYQRSNTDQMVFGVARLVSYVSEFMTLLPGDIIATGTPAGVGLAQRPTPVFLAAGQTVTLGIAGLGEQSHVCEQAASESK
jgi:2-keto-4-pentenoate hydratase/2-oxohepta-3-ene-1,7-dioic acid hydratase in catechol pathway